MLDGTTSTNNFQLRNIEKSIEFVFDNALSDEQLFSIVELTASSDINFFLTVKETEEALFH